MAEEKTEHESSSEESHDLETSETPEHEEAHGSEEAREHESSDAPSSDEHASAEHASAAAKGPRRRKVSRRIRRYEVPIDAGEGEGSQTILRFKPLGFWKMFFAVMLGFFASLLLFLVTAVLAVIILGNVLWNTVETRVGNWVTDIANRVSDELDSADQSVQNIVNTVEQGVDNITGDGSTTTTAASSGEANSSATTAASSSDSG